MSHNAHLLEALSDYSGLWLGFGVSFLATLIIYLTSAYHHQWSGDDLLRVQKSHDQAFVPRIGGIAIFFAMIVLYIFLGDERQTIFGPLVLASFPIFFVGIAEDTLHNVRPIHRLFVAFLCGVFGWWITGYRLSHVGLPGIDWILESSVPVSIFVTAFAVAGFTHAHNLIDGVNGLSSGLAGLFVLGIGLIAYQVDDLDLWYATISFLAVIVGFYLINFPLGKIFLGDAGAYLCGFVAAWLGIILTSRNASVSEFAPFLLGIHAISEAIFSMVRRKLSGRLAMQADVEHFHLLVKRKYFRLKFPGRSKLFYNSLTGFLIVMMNVPVVLVAICYFDEVAILIAVSVMYLILFVAASKYLEPDIFKNPTERSPV